MEHDADPAAIVRWVEARMGGQHGAHPRVDVDTELLRDARLDSLDIGAGAVVRGNIADNSVVLGNPGRVVMQTSLAEQLLVNHPDRMYALHLTARERERLLRSHFRIPA